MDYTNAEKMTAVLTHWLKPMGDAVAQMVLQDKLTTANEWAKRMFRLPADYSITNDLAFLVKPTVDCALGPTIKGLLQNAGVDDAEIPHWSRELVKAMESEVTAKGQIMLFGAIVLSTSDVSALSDLIEKNLPLADCNTYNIVT